MSLIATEEGSTNVIHNNITSNSLVSTFVQGRTQGSTTLTVSAPGYNDATIDVTVVPSGFIFSSINEINIAAGSSRSVSVVTRRLDPVTLNFSEVQFVRGGLSVDVEITSSDEGVGTISTSPLTFTSNNVTLSTAFVASSPGVSILSVVTPAGFTTPSNNQQRTANVSP